MKAAKIGAGDSTRPGVRGRSLQRLVSLTREEVSALKTGDIVTVTWFGGNGPHEYTVRNDLKAYDLYRTASATSVAQLLDGHHDIRRKANEVAERRAQQKGNNDE